MRRFRIAITQVLQGFVDIQASNEEEARSIADCIYNYMGKELPDMEECGPLEITIVADK